MFKTKVLLQGCFSKNGYTEDTEIYFNIHCPVIGQIGIGMCF